MLKGLLISAAVSALLSGFGTWKITHDLMEAKVHRLTANYAEAERVALAAQSAKIEADHKTNLAAAVAEAQAQVIIVRKTSTIMLEVPRYVTVNHACLSFGFVRVLDAAGFGVSPDELPLPAGQFNDYCAPVDAVAVARALVANIGEVRANAQQLDALADVTRRLAKQPR